MNNNFENANMSPSVREKPVLEDVVSLEKLYEKMEKKLARYTPDPNDFRDIYGNKQVDLDIRYADALEEKWEMEKEQLPLPQQQFVEKEKMKATIAEGIMVNQLSGGWLNIAEDSHYSVVAAQTSRPDDYGIVNKSRKGFDLSLEFIDNNNQNMDTYAGASVDVTTSGNENTVKNKISRIIDLIKSGEAPIIKYFENSTETFKGSIDVAPFVLVLAEPTVEDLFSKELRNDKKGLEDHPVQLSLLNQLQEQAETFLAIAEQYENTTLVKSYGQSLKHINYLLIKKAEYYKSLDVDANHLDEKYRGLKLLHKAIVDSLIR